MINRLDINLSQINLIKENSLNQNGSNLEIESFLKDFLNLFSEGEKSANLGSLFFTPFVPFISLDFQNFFHLENLMKNFENIKEELIPLHRLITLEKGETMDITNKITNTMKVGSEINPSLIPSERKDEKLLLNSPDNLEEVLKNTHIDKDENSSVKALFKLESEAVLENTQKRNLINLEYLNTDKESLIDTVKAKEQREQKTNNIISNLSNSHTNVTQTDIPQKIVLNITRLHEVSDIISKGFFNSQKTLVVLLEPPELGKILIKLSMENSGIKAEMRVDYPQVKEMITNLIPEIKSNLQSSGVKISDFLLDSNREHRGYSDSSSGQKKNKREEKFLEYFA